jgi:hypothetical protein
LKEYEMAVMWPRILPTNVKANVLRSAECKVYAKIESNLEHPFVVFYSRPWMGLKPDGEEIDGECDFVIAHPDLGMLTLEVKGGAVSYDPKEERWTSKDRWGCTHIIKNPVYQARTSKYQILKKLSASRLWKPHRIRIRHGVVFPDCDRPGSDLGTDMPLKIFCFNKEFDNSFCAWIMDRMKDSGDTDKQELPLGIDGLRVLENILAHPFHLHVPLSSILAGDDRDICVLTQQQFHILRAIECIKRAGISGGAGTGKTVLAMEEARRCAESGLRTLFTCYNKPLAKEIRRRTSGIKMLDVLSFHELCFRFSEMAGLFPPKNVAEKELFEIIYPELLVQSFELLPHQRYDAIIADEGQDMRQLWWIALDSVLNPQGSQILRIFYDSNQKVYGAMVNLPSDVQLVPIRLTLNLRNTRRIYEVVQRFYKGHVVEAVGPEGVPVEWIAADDVPSVRQQVVKRISTLSGREEVKLNNIAVLVENENIKKALAPDGRLGKHNVMPCEKSSSDAVILDTIRRFKGLESQVVMLFVSGSLPLDDELLYVATSRARTHLVIIGRPEHIYAIKSPCCGEK